MRWFTPLLMACLLASNLSAQSSPGGLPGAGGRPPAADTPPNAAPEGGGKKIADHELEELIARVLRTNPDVQAAEAKCRAAEIELRRARLAATQKLVTVRSQIDGKAKMADALEHSLRVAQEMQKAGRASAQELLQAQEKLAAIRAEMAQLESERASIFGDVLASARDEIRVLSITEAGDLSSRSTGLDGRNVLFIRPAVGGPVAERVLKALDEPVKPARADMELMLDDVLGMLQPAKGPRIPYLVQPGVKNVKGIRLMEAELPLGAWLLAVEDLSPDVRFVVREYGVLVTTKDRVPEGAVSLRAFWHGRPDIRPLDKDPLRPGSVPPPPTKP